MWEMSKKEIRMIPFRAAHADLIDVRESSAHFFKLPNAPLMLQSLEARHSAWTVILDGRILAIVGFVPVSSVAVEYITLPSIYIDDNYIAYARFIKKLKEDVANAYGFKRIQVTCRATKELYKWEKFLGFKYEGTLKGAEHDGADQYIFGEVRKADNVV